MISELYGLGRGRIVESDAQVLRLVRRWIIFDWLRWWPSRWRFCRRFGRSAFPFLVRRGAAAAWSKVRQGVRQDNWSEGRFGCRWLNFEDRNFKSHALQNMKDASGLRNTYWICDSVDGRHR